MWRGFVCVLGVTCIHMDSFMSSPTKMEPGHKDRVLCLWEFSRATLSQLSTLQEVCVPDCSSRHRSLEPVSLPATTGNLHLFPLNIPSPPPLNTPSLHMHISGCNPVILKPTTLERRSSLCMYMNSKNGHQHRREELRKRVKETTFPARYGGCTLS